MGNILPNQNTPPNSYVCGVHFLYVHTDKADGYHVIVLNIPDLQDQQVGTAGLYLRATGVKMMV